MCKGQGCKRKLNTCDLRALHQTLSSLIADRTRWVRDYHGKPLLTTTMWIYIHRRHLKLYGAKKKPYINNNLEEMDAVSSRPRTLHSVISNKFTLQGLSWIEVFPVPLARVL